MSEEDDETAAQPRPGRGPSLGPTIPTPVIPQEWPETSGTGPGLILVLLSSIAVGGLATVIFGFAYVLSPLFGAPEFILYGLGAVLFAMSALVILRWMRDHA